MKKINFLAILVLVFTFSLTSCSSDDDGGSSDNSNFYFDIEVNGENYQKNITNFDGIYGFIYGETYCNTGSQTYIVSTGTGQYIEEENFDFSINIIHPEYEEDFLAESSSNSHVGSQASGCYYPFDIDLIYFSQNDYTVEIDNGNVNNANEIESITKVTEYESDILYSVRGNYTAVVINGDGETYTIEGNYNLPAYVMK